MLGFGLNIKYFKRGTSLPLDNVSDILVAYSTRELSANWKNQSVIRVRRSSDNEELNFTATEIVNGTLLTWVGDGNNGAIVTWYDQSGNGYNATQAVSSEQPLIVDGTYSNEIIYINGLPAIYFDSARNTRLATVSTMVTGSQSHTDIMVVRLINSGNFRDTLYTLGGTDTNEVGSTWRVLLEDDNNVWIRVYGNHAWDYDTTFDDIYGRYKLFTHSNIFKGPTVSDTDVWLNNNKLIEDTSNVIDATINLLTDIGLELMTLRPDSIHEYTKGYMQEFIILSGEQADVRNNIVKNQLNNVVNKKILDYTDKGVVAYSLRNINSKYNGAIIKVRRSSDNEEQNFTASEIINGTLENFCGVADGFVVTWYDQSGNNTDLNQPAPNLQPRIINAGVLITEEGYPCLEFTNHYMYTPSRTWQFDTVSLIGVLKFNNLVGGLETIFRIRENGGAGLLPGISWEREDNKVYSNSASVFDDGNGNALQPDNNGTFAKTSLEMYSLYYNKITAKTFSSFPNSYTWDNVTAGNTPIDSINVNFNLSVGNNFQDLTRNLNANVCELILLSEDLINERSKLESFILDHYSLRI